MQVKLPDLEVVDFDGNFLCETGETIAKNAASWPSLKFLGLGDFFDSRCILELSKADFPCLERLDIAYTSETWEGRLDMTCILALRSSIGTRRPRFNELNISGEEIALDAKLAFLDGNFPRLEDINFLTEGAQVPLLEKLAEVARNGRFQYLKSLKCSFSYDMVGEDATSWEAYSRALGEFLLSTSWNKLQSLSIECLEPKDGLRLPEALGKAAEQQLFPALESLKIEELCLPSGTASEIETLFKHPWSCVKHLSLTLTDESASTFANIAQDSLPNLRTASITAYRLSEESLKILLDAPWNSLKEITIYAHKFIEDHGSSGLERIRGPWRLRNVAKGEAVFYQE